MRRPSASFRSAARSHPVKAGQEVSDVQSGASSAKAAVLIMAGGRGTRFWPESRLHRPKPLFSIDGETTLIADTVTRMHPAIAQDRVFVLASADQAPFFRPVLRRLISARNLVVEPEGRGTAVAIAYGSGVISQRLGDQTVIAVMPADHYVTPASAFQQTLREAVALAAATAAIVLIGVKPTRPETGFGYQKLGRVVRIAGGPSDNTIGRSYAGKSKPSTESGVAGFKLVAFVEKPPAPAAQKMMRSGRYLWNAGMFVMRASVVAREFEQHAPPLAALMRSAPSKNRAQLASSYRRLEFDSFDRVVVEKTENLLTVRAGFQWHDVGSWEGLWEALRGDSSNVVSGNVLALDADGVLARSRNRLMVLLGVKDLIAIETADAILIADRSQSQNVRRVIEELARRGLRHYL
jgi:mannose-1-phosphate guanylyltransferase